MGTTITIDSSQSEKNKGGASGGSKPQSIYLQLIPAQVEHVVLSSDDLGYYEPSDINAIFAKKHAGEEIDYSQTSKNKYYPMFRGMVDTPNKEDQVLIYDGEAGQDYYLGPLNSLNNPNFNIDPLRKTQIQINRNTSTNNSSNGTIKSKIGMSENYKTVPIKRLSVRRNKKLDDPENTRVGEDGSIVKEETFGDMIFEGRYNNSIRLGYRYTDPLIFISNGRRVNQDQETFVDNSLIAMTTRGTLSDHLFPTNPNTPFPNFILGSETIELENPRLVGGGNPDSDGGVDGKFNYNYGNDDNGNPILSGQLFMNSDRLVFNSRKDTITLSAFSNLDMGAGNNLTINTKNYTSIESSNIYLGKQAQERKEPLVLGEQLRLILEEMVSILEIFKVTGTAAGISGTPAPDVVAKLTTLKNKLTSPTFFSEYHFIEDNGQKA
tara:strand:- start:67 stop:1374 length:1308 start_codon:yes stop_codon:yes gene_type:complete